MLKPAWPIAFLSLVLVAADKTSDDKAVFQGEWRMSYGVKDGKRLPPELLKQLVFVFKGDKLTLKIQDEAKEARFVLAPDKSPKQITILHDDGKTKPVHGIYVLKKTRIDLCFAEPGQVRPREFPRQGGKGQLMVLVTEKK